MKKIIQLFILIAPFCIYNSVDAISKQSQCNAKYPWTVYQSISDKCVCINGNSYNSKSKNCITPNTSSCNIKWNVSQTTGEKIYHIPGGQFYNKTTVETWKGERWFCSEKEAINAGWRKDQSINYSEYTIPTNSMQSQCNSKYPWTVYQSIWDKCICTNWNEFNDTEKTCWTRSIEITNLVWLSDPIYKIILKENPTYFDQLARCENFDRRFYWNDWSKIQLDQFISTGDQCNVFELFPSRYNISNNTIKLYQCQNKEIYVSNYSISTKEKTWCEAIYKKTFMLYLNNNISLEWWSIDYINAGLKRIWPFGN